MPVYFNLGKTTDLDIAWSNILEAIGMEANELNISELSQYNVKLYLDSFD